MRAEGPFTVKMTPAADAEGAVGRMLLDKQYHGALEATATGQMLTGMGSVKGSAAYVAIEQVAGTLDGRAGSFLLSHRGVMDRGTPALVIEVVPDSGTGALMGLQGSMQIVFAADGSHTYVFDYTLPPST